MTGTFELLVRDGKIASLKVVPDEATRHKLGAAFGPTATLAQLNAFIEAGNMGDLAALASTFYADETVFSFGPIGPGGELDTVTGIAAVLARDAKNIANHQQVRISNATAEGNTARGNFSVINDELVDAGLAPVTGTFELRVRNRKVASFKEVPDEATQQKLAAAFAPPPARELTALVGWGRDTEAINSFLLSTLKVRAGDTITWKISSDDIHTVTFLGGAPLSGLAIPAPAGGPTDEIDTTDLMLNPQVMFGTRAPGAPVEAYNGAGVVNSG